MVGKPKEEQIKDYEKIIEKGQAIEEMTMIEGWKILERWIKKQIEKNTEDLLTKDKCSKEEMPEGRASINAYRSILSQVEKRIKAKEDAYQKIKELQASE